LGFRIAGYELRITGYEYQLRITGNEPKYRLNKRLGENVKRKNWQEAASGGKRWQAAASGGKRRQAVASGGKRWQEAASGGKGGARANYRFPFCRLKVICNLMRALVYDIRPVGWATCKCLRLFWRGCILSRLNGLALREIPAPELPGDDWVRVRTLMGGICGSDLAIIDQKQPADSILQAFSSAPMGLGHENVAVVEEVGRAVAKTWLGRRVCVEPTLCCKVRGIEPPCERCAEGQLGACESFGDDGSGSAKLPPGTSIGYNSRTGGSFGECFVAHVSQLVAVPDALSDEQALLTDPLACALHAVLRADVGEAGRVLVCGCGMLGLGIVASLRAVGYTGRIDVVDRQEYLRVPAEAAGADAFLILPGGARQRFERIAERTGATVQRVRFGNYMLSGGYDVVFDCVGSRLSIGESLKWAKARGQVVLVATGHGRGVDLTPIWFRELTVIGAWGRQAEDFEGKKIGTYQLTHRMMVDGRLGARGLLTHTFPLADYRTALKVAMCKAEHKAVKVAFDFR